MQFFIISSLKFFYEWKHICTSHSELHLGVMVSMLASIVDSSPGWVKAKTIILLFANSPLSMQQ
jgi:hypothetical protein